MSATFAPTWKTTRPHLVPLFIASIGIRHRPGERRLVGTKHGRMFRRHEDARLSWDIMAHAAEAKVPALVLCGADDNVNRRGSTPVATATRLAALIPGCELFLIFPNVKHMTFWDGTGGVAALQEFLARHPIATS